MIQNDLNLIDVEAAEHSNTTKHNNRNHCSEQCKPNRNNPHPVFFVRIKNEPNHQNNNNLNEISQSNISPFETSLETLKAELKSSKADNQIKSIRISELEAKVKSLKSETKKLKAENQAKAAQNIRLFNENKEKTKSLTDKLNEVRQLKEKSEMLTEICFLKQKINDLKETQQSNREKRVSIFILLFK